MSEKDTRKTFYSIYTNFPHQETSTPVNILKDFIKDNILLKSENIEHSTYFYSHHIFPHLILILVCRTDFVELTLVSKEEKRIGSVCICQKKDEKLHRTA